MAHVARPKRPHDGDASTPGDHKRPKLLDLPMDQAKKSAVDGLVQTFRKKGEFDNVRNSVRGQFESGVSGSPQPF